eukprot:TRINITY_DN17524_c0_g1_i1.p1 TRINITY_DN17524_c0_g1~~TRINITY_DN17524_c0_g1_i1.p1  ORF type:complete len:396 (+),score=74.43 TRINITY_DN17524_c0_g1_i1:71-1258(+)
MEQPSRLKAFFVNTYNKFKRQSTCSNNDNQSSFIHNDKADDEEPPELLRDWHIINPDDRMIPNQPCPEEIQREEDELFDWQVVSPSGALIRYLPNILLLNNDDTDEYYTVLGVEATSSFDEIKRAYLAKARILHPDKNSDPDANEKFKLVCEAYQILSDDAKRQTYNKYGKVYMDQNIGFEPELGRLFGQFGRVFGDIMSVLRNLNQKMGDDQESFADQQSLQLSVALLQKIEPFLSDNVQVFTEEIEKEVKDLAQSTPRAGELLELVGYVYSQAYRGATSNRITSIWIGFEDTTRVYKSKFQILRQLVKLSLMQAQAAASDDVTAETECEAEGLRLMWILGKMLAERILRKACELVLTDAEASPLIIKKRGLALLSLAKIYSVSAPLYANPSSP